MPVIADSESKIGIQKLLMQPVLSCGLRIDLAMPTIQQIRCPNCGRPAEREHFASRQVLQTQCPCCDYLLVTCSLTGRVIEAYAPGIGSRPPQWG